MTNTPPQPTPEAGKAALRALLSTRSLLPALAALHAELGDIFSMSLPGFQPVVVAGPDAARFILVEARHKLSWRSADDPVARLLRKGLLVQDGEPHDELRRVMMPALHRRRMEEYIEVMVRCTDQVINGWQNGSVVDMLVEMRRVALFIFMETLFGVDFRADIKPLWPAILRTLKYISPGPWLIWKDAPRPGYGWALRRVDEYLYGLIHQRRSQPTGGEDLLSLLVAHPEMDDDLIRDQMLTMLIAGHDTSTALLAWVLYLLGSHSNVYQQVLTELDEHAGADSLTFAHVDRLAYLEQVIKETLRLYPPIHVGNRIAMEDLEFGGYTIPAGRRVMYSIYATHRDRRYWTEPDRFNPERFAPGFRPTPYTYLPFGGGARNCIGAAFAQVEVRTVLARLLQRFDLSLVRPHVRQAMGATLEPHPGVFMRVRAK